MKTFKSALSAPKKINRYNSAALPVFKVNFNGDILYANNAAMQLLYQVGVSANRKIPKEFIEEHDKIFIMHKTTNVLITTTSNIFNFDVVTFDEGGYIGFYANQIKHQVN